MISFSTRGRFSMVAMALTLCFSTLGACDDAEPKATGCEPGAAVCQCTKQSDCAQGENCVNNACVAATAAAGPVTGAGGGASAGITSTGSGGGAGEASSAVGAGGAPDTGSQETTTTGTGGSGGNETGLERAVVLVLDRSTSAEQGFDDGMSRWEAIVAALLEPDGAVESNTARMALGVLDFTGFNGGSCPEFGSGVAPDAENFDAIEEYLSELELPEEKSETPTREAIEEAVSMLSGRSEPKSIVLVTDGITDDTCENFDNPGCVTQAYYAAQQAYSSGVSTYILGITDLEDDYLQGVANAGTGQPVADPGQQGLHCGPDGEQPQTAEQGGNAPYWQAENSEQIKEHLDAIFETLLAN